MRWRVRGQDPTPPADQAFPTLVKDAAAGRPARPARRRHPGRPDEFARFRVQCRARPLFTLDIYQKIKPHTTEKESWSRSGALPQASVVLLEPSGFRDEGDLRYALPVSPKRSVLSCPAAHRLLSSYWVVFVPRINGKGALAAMCQASSSASCAYPFSSDLLALRHSLSDSCNAFADDHFPTSASSVHILSSS